MNTVTVGHASAIFSGYGHQKITVDLVYNGETKTFWEVTNNMPGYDAATELEGQEYYEALYDLIDRKIEDQVTEWMNEVDNS